MDATGDPTTLASEICVEVMTQWNSDEEMQEKRDLYLQAGAEEVWIVGMKNDAYQALLIGFGVIAALVLVANALTGRWIVRSTSLTALRTVRMPDNYPAEPSDETIKPRPQDWPS